MMMNAWLTMPGAGSVIERLTDNPSRMRVSMVENSKKAVIVACVPAIDIVGRCDPRGSRKCLVIAATYHFESARLAIEEVGAGTVALWYLQNDDVAASWDRRGSIRWRVAHQSDSSAATADATTNADASSIQW